MCMRKPARSPRTGISSGSEKRELLRRNIPVEQARDLLRRIDAGEKVELYQDIPLTEAGLHFLRLQLADYDAGLKPAYEIFGDEQDDAQFNRMLESEAKNANLQLFAPDQGEAPPVRQEESCRRARRCKSC